MDENRKQLTLFIEESNINIEKIRAKYNSEQYNLISAHITLCREDEIKSIDKVIQRIKSITLKKPIRIKFKNVLRFSDGKGILIPATYRNIEFRELRKSVLGQRKLNKEQFPHITLMHPRNSICTDEIFEQIKELELPTELEFGKISLIEQINGGKWNILKEFNILNKNVEPYRV
jgi:2'-5' RNA ligase